MKVWSWRQAVAKAKLESSTKLVLYTLANYMNEHGGGCYPTIDTIAEESDLSDRTVRTHLQKAKEAGFIRISKHGFSGQEWANNEYQAIYPEDMVLGNQTQDIEADNDKKGTAAITGASLQQQDKGAATITGGSSEGAATDDQKVRQPLPLNSPENSPEAANACAHTREAEPPPSVDAAAAALKIIQEFEQASGRVFGMAFRRYINNTEDQQQAMEFLAAGATPEFCREVFQRKMQQRKNSGGKAPGSLLYFRNIIPEELLLARASGKVIPQKTASDDAGKRDITLEELGGDTEENRVLLQIFALLRAKHGEKVFVSWIAQLRIRLRLDGTVEIAAPSPFHRDYVLQRYETDIQNCVRKAWPHVPSIKITHR